MTSNSQATTENPYESPRGPASEPLAGESAVQFSLMRGLSYAMPAAVLGLLIPIVLLGSFTLLINLFSDNVNPNHLTEDLRDVCLAGLHPGLQCGWLFAVAAVINFSPASRFGFVRALMILGLLAIAGIVLSSVVVDMLGIGPRRGEDYFEVHRISIYAFFQFVIATVLSVFLIYRQNVKANKAALCKKEAANNRKPNT